MNDRISVLLTRRRYVVVYHIFLQLLVLLITSNILWDEPDALHLDRLSAWLVYTLQLDVVIYGNMLLLVPRLLARNRPVLYFAALTVLIAASATGIGSLQPPEAMDNPAMNSAGSRYEWLGTMAAFIAMILFMQGLTVLQMLQYRIKNQRRIEALSAATMRVELDNLRNQINPHFLFNMLNNANIMAGEDREKSSFILSKLNDLLHYQIEQGSRAKIRLADDVEFMEDYLALEKLRRDRFDYSISVDGPTDIELPPLLFIPFVENAVKHNPENDSHVDISLRVASDRLYFACRNPKARSPRPPSAKKSSGIGLVNIRRRLDLLFGSNYSLEIVEDDSFYTVKLGIKR